MRPSQQDDPHTLCTKCKNFIRTANFLIHEARCQGQNSSLRQSQVTSRILDNSKMKNNRSPIFSPNSQNRREEEQRIPCHFCSYPQTLAELDTHPRECLHREEQCSRCKSMFPKSLMQQHAFVCPANRRQQPRRNQQFFYHDAQQEEQDYPPPIAMMRRNRPPGDLYGMMQMMFGQFNRQPRRRQPRRMVIQLGNGGGGGGFFQLIQLLAGHRGENMEAGLSKQNIKKFPVSKFKKGLNKQEDGQMCIICYCNFEEGENFMTLPCKHLFHPECIGTWLQKNPTCPVCKRNLGQNGRHQQQRSPNRPIRRSSREPRREMNFHQRIRRQ